MVSEFSHFLQEVAEAVVAEGGGRRGRGRGSVRRGEYAEKTLTASHPPATCLRPWFGLRVTSAADESRCKQIRRFQPPAKCVTILFPSRRRRLEMIAERAACVWYFYFYHQRQVMMIYSPSLEQFGETTEEEKEAPSPLSSPSASIPGLTEVVGFTPSLCSALLCRLSS